MRSLRMPFGPGRAISRLIPLVLIGVLATGATAAGTADHSITPGTWEWPAPEAEAVEQTVESDASEAKTRFVSLDPAPSAGPLEMNLFEKGDLLKQATSSMCVARAAQTMMNMIDSGSRTGRWPTRRSSTRSGASCR